MSMSNIKNPYVNLEPIEKRKKPNKITLRHEKKSFYVKDNLAITQNQMQINAAPIPKKNLKAEPLIDLSQMHFNDTYNTYDFIIFISKI